MSRIRVDGDSSRHVAETRCYFPEWAERPSRRLKQLENERNSYAAGGYAEEFGYRVQSGSPTAAPTLIGDPEGSVYWRVQVGALHPGYPECAKPVGRELGRLLQSGRVDSCDSAAVTPESGGDCTYLSRPDAARAFKIIRVGGDHRASAARGGLGTRLFLLWRELRILRRGFG